MKRPNGNAKAKKASGRILLALGLMLTTPVLAQNARQPGSHPRRQVLVSIPHHKLAVLEEGQVVRIFPVAVGAAVSPSPTGDFQIVSRVANPTYYHPGVVIPPGGDNPVGTRWVGLNQKGYGIHGTNEPRSIGKAASHGCIRLRNRDIEQFFRMVSVGDTVEIRGERDVQIAQIFGGEAETTATAVAQAQPATMMQVGGGQ